MGNNGSCSTDSNSNSSCCCKCHHTVGILIALIGLTVLLGTFDVLTQRIVAIVWPLLLILIGLKKSFGRQMCKCCSKS